MSWESGPSDCDPRGLGVPFRACLLGALSSLRNRSPNPQARRAVGRAAQSSPGSGGVTSGPCPQNTCGARTGHSQLVQLLAEAPAVAVDPGDGVVAEVELVQGREAVQ